MKLAATKTHSELIYHLLQQHVNDYSNSKYLAKGIQNPIYLMLKDEAKKHQLNVRIVSNTLVELLDKNQVIGVFSPNSPNNGIATKKLLNDKNATKKLLTLNQIRTPQGKLFLNYENAWKYIKAFSKNFVVKPLTGSGGKGVTANIQAHAEVDFMAAWNDAKSYSSKIIVEEHIEGDEVRIFVLNGKVEGAVIRMPAYVIGDGRHCLQELIEIKNQQRKKNPLLRLYPIKLNHHSGDYIPSHQEIYKLTTTSNIAQGGDSLSILNVLHPSIIAECERVWRVIPGATQIGLDVILKDFTAPISEDNFCIIEVNGDPAVATPTFALAGQPTTDLPQKLIQYAVNHPINDQETEQFNHLNLYRDYSNYVLPCDSYLTINLIKQAAYRRGLKVTALSHILTLVSDGQQSVVFWYGIPHLTKIATPQITINKELTKLKLNEINGIIMPKGDVFDINDNKIEQIYLKNKYPVVIKPLGGSGGAGVFSNIDSLEKLKMALQFSQQAGTKKIICERYYVGKDYRFFITKKGDYAVTERIPAHVVGDGQSTIAQLIQEKNIERQMNPFLGYKKIKMTAVFKENLKSLGYTENTILADQQYLEFDKVANIGIGGESVDVTEVVHPSWIALAEKVRSYLYDAIHIGIDIVAEDISCAVDIQSWCILEANSNPDYGLHHFPKFGQARDAAGAVIEAVFPSACLSQDIFDYLVEIKNLKVLQQLKQNIALFADLLYVRKLGDFKYSLSFKGAKDTNEILLKFIHNHSEMQIL